MSLSTFFNIWYIDDSSLKASLLGPGPMVLHFTEFFYKIKWSIYLYLQVAKKQRMHYTQKISMKKTPLHMFTSIKKVNHSINNTTESHYHLVFIHAIKSPALLGRTLNNSFELYHTKSSLSLIGGLSQTFSQRSFLLTVHQTAEDGFGILEQSLRRVKFFDFSFFKNHNSVIL